MISRQWRGLARSERAQDYVRHLRTETLPALRRIPGFVDASILSRTLANGVEFQIVTRWESIDAIVEFAGADPEVSVVPPVVMEMMIDYDPRGQAFRSCRLTRKFKFHWGSRAVSSSLKRGRESMTHKQRARRCSVTSKGGTCNVASLARTGLESCRRAPLDSADKCSPGSKQ